MCENADWPWVLGLETCIPQSYPWGSEGQVDWYEAYADLGGERTCLQVFEMRSMAGGASFHRAYPRATQQAFLEGHELAFKRFGGVFKRLRYDNLKSAVKKILQGHRREETARFIAFRSHWRFEAVFCNPGKNMPMRKEASRVKEDTSAGITGCLFRKPRIWKT